MPGRLDRAMLNDSVGNRITEVTDGSGYYASCPAATNRTSRCVLTTTDFSDSGVVYRVVGSENCWTGTLVRTGGMVGLPRRASDCVHLLDQLAGV